ncbi:hypothetical protein [Alicyclobacillus kakegawensis]|uniref:hypothetical protein n=1 Tax=Alicyclobacillus kakegawensis TaxID=392012 RepID=UPI0012EE92D4|nr:hypothetical protein [Alicyclobacillus kakegawensis]
MEQPRLNHRVTRRRPIEISLEDRWVVIGATGAGKTTFVRRLLTAYWRAAARKPGRLPIYILDTKGFAASRIGRDDFRMFYRPGIGRLHRDAIPPKIIAPKHGPEFIVWQPDPEQVTEDHYDAFFMSLYRSGVPSLTYVDELSSLTDSSGKKFPRYYDILLKQGRGIYQALITTTQSPSYIPPSVIRQTTHMVRFRLNDTYDLQKIARVMGKAVEEEPPDEFGFWYRDARKPKAKNPPVYYTDLSEFFGD